MNYIKCIKTGKRIKQHLLCRLLFFCAVLMLFTAVRYSDNSAAAQQPKFNEYILSPAEIKKSSPANGTAAFNVPPETTLQISAGQIPAVQYRRWLAPLDHILDWPLKEGPYAAVKRERFERWTEIMKQTQQYNSSKFSSISRIVLEGRITADERAGGKESLSGTGIIEFQPSLFNLPPDNSEQTAGQNNSRVLSIPLEFWNIWSSSPEYEDGTPASFVSDSGGGTQLLLQNGNTRSKKLNKIRFRWSLQCCRNNQESCQFDFQLPSCPGIELSLQLPPGKKPLSSAGIIIPPIFDTADTAIKNTETKNTDTKNTDTEDKNGEKLLRRWRVLFGSSSKASVIIENKENNLKEQRTIPVREQIVYNISPQGTDITKYFFFSAEEIPAMLTLEAETPLKVFDIVQNDKPVQWTSAVSKGEKTVIQFTPLTGNKTNSVQITVKAVVPFTADKDWQLPRIRLNSPLIFWTETRSVILVHPHLQVKKMEVLNGVQTVSAPLNQTNSEVFTFQYFQPDAANIVHLSQQQPVPLISSTAQILYSDSEITCNLTLDCSVKNGELYTFRFPVSKEWAISTVKAVSDDVISWDVIEQPENSESGRILTVQLNGAVRPKSLPLRIQVLGRYLSVQNFSVQKDSFKLTDFIPLLIPFTPEQTQLAALFLETPKQLKCISPEITLQEISISGNSPLYRQFSALQSAMPRGNLFLLNTRTKDVLFRTEQLNPVYSGETDVSFLLKENSAAATYQFRCNPADSKIDKVYVFFTSPPDNQSVLNWSTDSEVLPVEAKKLSEKELDDVLLQSRVNLHTDKTMQGTVWEIRFPSSPSSPFTFRADTSADIHDLMHLPLASLPFAVQQSGNVQIISPRLTNYQVVNSRLTAVPVPLPKEDEYQIIRSAFKYSPMEEFRRQETSPLMLKQVPAGDLPPSSWIWMQRNNRHYESSGFVKTNTLFFLVNRGKENLKITLPENVTYKNILSVRIGKERVIWYPARDKNPPDDNGADENAAGGGTETIIVPLPQNLRFVCVAVEYSRQTKPLLKHKTDPSNRLLPDVPVIAEENIFWYPSELDVSVSNRNAAGQNGSSFRNSSFICTAASYQLPGSNFRPFAFSFWYELFTENFYRKEAVQAAKTFLSFLETAAALPEETAAENKMRKNGTDIIWAVLQKKEHLLSEMYADEEPVRNTKTGKRYSGEPPVFKIMIDKPAFNYYGISPNSRILPDGIPVNSGGNEILEQNRLMLFVTVNRSAGGVPEYTFYLTSVLTAALNRYYDSKPIGNNIRFVPDSKKIIQSGSVKTFPRNENGADSASTRSDWTALNDWIQKSSNIVFPWNVTPQQLEPYSDAAGWFASEIPAEKKITVYTVRRAVINAEYFLAFLAALVLTWKKPFSSPLFMLLAMLLCEVAARNLPICYIGIPCGGFLGILVSFGFILVRKRTGKEKSVPLHKSTDDSQEYELPAEQQTADRTISEGEKKEEPAFFTSIFLRRFISSENGNSGKPPLISRMFAVLLFTAASCGFCSMLFSADSVPVQIQMPDSLPAVSTADLTKQTNKQEPFRVFYPTDGTQKITGDFVWLPERFFQYLYKNTWQKQQGQQQHQWSIERAEYSGVLSEVPLSGGLKISEFKAVYEIILNENNASIILPPLPLLQDGALWDSVPVQPIWEIGKIQNIKEQGIKEQSIKEQSSKEAPETAGMLLSAAENNTVKERYLVFNIENERKGRHRLELTLDIKPVLFDALNKVCFDIPGVPNAVFILNVPVNAPVINITNCCGSISYSAAESKYEAQIGPSRKCSFSWTDNQYTGTPANIEADTLFRLRTRPLQLRAKFRCRIDGGKINFINLKTDLNWQLSGQYHCEECPIEHIETYSSAAGKTAEKYLPDTQQEITRLVFKTPVSGLLTIQAGFVLKDFSGIGNIGLPQIRPADIKTGKAMLAVLDSTSLDIDAPNEFLASGFESLWSSVKPGSSGKSAAETTDSPPETLPANPADALAEHTIAVYDLTAAPPSWTLSLKTKKETPSLTVQHFCCFDLGGSTLNTDAVFYSGSDVFQQHFSIPDTVQISSVNVRDAQDNPVECTWASIPAAPAAGGENADEKYTVFFKRPLSGQYRMNISVFMPAAEIQTQNIPLLIFDNAALTEQKLLFYRTPAVVADLTVPHPKWTKQEEKHPVPPQFTDAVFLSSWVEQTAKPEEDTLTDRNYSERPSVRVVPNRPSVRSETVTALYRDAATDSWSIVYDILWNISQGELNEIRYFWDERCGTILAVEPAMQFKLEQKEHRLQLVIRQEESSAGKFTGRIHLRIKALLNAVDGIVSVPKIQPVLEDSIRYSNKNYVVLQRQSSDIAIPWNYSSLTPADSDLIEYLKNLMLFRFNNVFPADTSDAAVLQQPVSDLRREIRTEPGTALSSLFSPFSAAGIETLFRENRISSDAVFLQATSGDFTCSITRKNERPAATLYDIRYYVSDGGVLFGVLTADIKSFGNNSFILTLPPNSELLQLVSNGICSEGILLMERRWKINLYSSAYPQRLNIVFRNNAFSAYPYKGRQNDAKHFLSAVLPVLENVDVQGTLWSFSFSPLSLPHYQTERSNTAVNPLFDVSVVQEKSAASDMFSIPSETENPAEHFDKEQLLTGLERCQTLLKFDLVRLNNLLFLLDSLPIRVLGQTDESRNWSDSWHSAWNGLTAEINRLQLEYPNAVFAEGNRVILTAAEKNSIPQRGLNIGELLETMKPADKSLQALLLRKKSLTANSSDAELKQPYSAPSVLLQRSKGGNDAAREIFGAANGSIKEIQLTVQIPVADWFDSSLPQNITGSIILVLLGILLCKSEFSELLLQFPHFWGAIAGVLLWCFTSLDIAAAVIFLSLFSFFYRSWGNSLDMLHNR